MRTLFRGLLWTIVGVLVLGHAAGGWYFSDQLIERGFEPSPDAIEVPQGDYQLVEVAYASPLGDMEAWHLPADGNVWVIHVHGKGATPAEAEHLFAPLQQAGYPQLAITYRNDAGQPEDPSGYSQYGLTEWQDVAGAVDFARANGAGGIVFSGFSSGASHILAYMYRHNLEENRGAFMDSPNIDQADTADYRVSMEPVPMLPITVPSTVVEVAKFFTSLRIGVNWKSIDYVEDAGITLHAPALLQHGTADGSVPIRQSVAFAEANPDLARLVPYDGAEHGKLYEADPEKYLREVLGFLSEVG
ncbi:MAG: alpha/beta hydrolase [Acidimicrobiia bacterium]